MDLEQARRQMLNQQLRPWEVLDPDVLAAFEEVPREFFVPERFQRLAFADTEIPLPHGQCLMRPSVEGRLLQALALAGDDEVLEVGAGSGFLTACLARLAGRVHSIEYYGDLAESARRRLAACGAADVRLEQADATALDAQGRYDAIAVTASVPDERGVERFRQALRVGGRLFVIVGRAPLMEAVLIRRVGALEWTRTSLFETSITPLIDASARPVFDF
jgi:protein-L-isoaspartate(D-aspartate) O-methyltransferase